jgi:hypothetical protein
MWAGRNPSRTSVLMTRIESNERSYRRVSNAVLQIRATGQSSELGILKRDGRCPDEIVF